MTQIFGRTNQAGQKLSPFMVEAYENGGAKLQAHA
jgi:hypothetical protein